MFSQEHPDSCPNFGGASGILNRHLKKPKWFALAQLITGNPLKDLWKPG